MSIGRGSIFALAAILGCSLGSSLLAQQGSVLDPGFRAEVDRKTGTTLSTGNRFELLLEAEEILARKIALVESARSRILVSTFLLFGHGDPMSRRLVDRLEARARAGVAVRVVVDRLLSLLDRPTTSRLERAGANVAYFDLRDKEIRNHAKMLVVDDRAALVGGSNLVHESFPFLPETRFSRWRDPDVLVEGPAVADVARGFDRLWARLTDGAPPAAVPAAAAVPVEEAAPGPTGTCRFLYNEPGEGEKEINDYYLLLFARARRRIVWQANFLDPAPGISGALRDAAARGVEVVLLSNSVPGPYHRYLDRRRRDQFAGTAVRVRRHAEGFDHAKILLVDDEVCTIGSYNHDWMSSENDSESVLVLHDPAIVAAVRDRVADSIRRSRPWEE